MKLTLEQQNQLAEARARNERRATMRFTAEQKKEWQEAVAQELASKDENIAHFRKIKSAAEQPGFFGDIRRAILLTPRPSADLAAEIGVEPHLLSEFRAGDAELPSAALDRLLESLGLRLMQEIPR